MHTCLSDVQLLVVKISQSFVILKLLRGTCLLLQVAATVENYAAVARTEVKEGRLFEDIQGLLSTAAESVKQAGARMQEAGTAGPLPVEQASRLLGDALAALSSVAERAHAFDSAHGFSVKLYTTVADGVEAVR